MLRHVRNPSAEEVWQRLQQHQKELPEIQGCWHKAYLASQETLTQVKQHEPLSCDIKLDLSVVQSHKTVTYIDC